MKPLEQIQKHKNASSGSFEHHSLDRDQFSVITESSKSTGLESASNTQDAKSEKGISDNTQDGREKENLEFYSSEAFVSFRQETLKEARQLLSDLGVEYVPNPKGSYTGFI